MRLGRFSPVWRLTPAGKHGAMFLIKVKCLLLRKSQNTKNALASMKHY